LAREETTSKDKKRDIRLSMLDVSGEGEWIARSSPLPFNATAPDTGPDTGVRPQPTW
jgi:hypothetical protein